MYKERLKPKNEIERDILNLRYEYYIGRIRRLERIIEILNQIMMEDKMILKRKSDSIIYSLRKKNRMMRVVVELNQVIEIDFKILDKLKETIIKCVG